MTNLATNQLIEQSMALQQRQQFPAALNGYQKVLQSEPENTIALANSAVIFHKLRHEMDALSHVDKVIQVDDDNPHYYFLKGSILSSMKKYYEALPCFEKVVSAIPEHPDALFRLGFCYESTYEPDKALDLYDKSFQLKPTAECAKRVGSIYRSFGMIEEAFKCFDKALQIEPKSASTHWLIAETHKAAAKIKKEPEQLIAAKKACQKTLQYDPQHHDALLNLGMLNKELWDWDDKKTTPRNIKSSIEWLMKNHYDLSISSLSIITSPWSESFKNKVMRYEAKRLEYVTQSLQDSLDFSFDNRSHDRLRIGYVSTTFRDHAVAHLCHKLFQYHDKSKYEVFVYSHTNTDESIYKKNIQQYAEHFIHFAEEDVKHLAKQIYQDEIDILIDMNGYNDDGKPMLLALKPAPIQVSYLGNSGYLALEAVDYILGDEIILPTEISDTAFEKRALLPDTYMITDDNMEVMDKPLARSDYGLPESSVVYCSFNNHYKVDLSLFQAWCDILKQVPNSVIWLYSTNDYQTDNLMRQIKSQGLSPDRFIFAKRVESKAEHLARYRLADVFLDAFVANAATTAVDALWAGLPILTVPGDGFFNRISSSLLKSVGLAELVMPDIKAYKDMAIELGHHPEKIASLKQKLAENKKSYPLFNTKLQTKNIEKAYDMMWKRYREGLPAETFNVERQS